MHGSESTACFGNLSIIKAGKTLCMIKLYGQVFLMH